jgi:E3 ubiquitin-protein ligase RFWD2
VRHGERNARLGAGASSIVSSIEFDRDYANFATGGVSKKVHVFSFAEACGGVDGDRAASDVDAPGPIQTLDAKSKLSCLSYNKHVANHLASSDYEGVVTVWDVEAGVAVAEFEEHDKRAWTVDYCRVDPRILASGSDDGLVKIWSTAQRGSVLEIDVRANVCCVQYGPLSAHQLAVGSADHRVHVFDLRNPSEAIATLRAHRKAVSYVRFLPSGDEMVSASTDSTLCVWDVKGNVAACARDGATGGGGGKGGAASGSGSGSGYGILSSAPAATLEGHVNEKNFVGLSVGAGELIACGSETNEAYVYHKSFNRPILTYDFAEKTERRGGRGGGGGGGDSGVRGQQPTARSPGAVSAGGGDGERGASGAPKPPGQPLFVSATCWRGDEPVLLAANSTGSIKVLQLVE